jgi:hypothetical protein
MAGKVGTITAAVVAALIGASPAATAQETTRGVTVLRGNPVTSDGTVMGVGNGGVEPGPAPANAANGVNQSGNLNALRTGSANAGGEIGNPLTGAGR